MSDGEFQIKTEYNATKYNIPVIIETEEQYEVLKQLEEEYYYEQLMMEEL